MKRTKILLSGLLASFLITGSAAAMVITSPAYTSPSYAPRDLGYAAKTSPIEVQIIGYPFEGETAETEKVITDAFERAIFGRKGVSFTTDTNLSTGSPYRVILLFSPAASANAARLCRTGLQPQAADAGSLKVLAAFCNGEVRLTSVSGWAGATSATSAVFAKLMEQVGRELFPNRNPDRRGGGGQFMS